MALSYKPQLFEIKVIFNIVEKPMALSYKPQLFEIKVGCQKAK